MGDRFYINVISTNNSDTHGWSADYFTLHSVKKGRSRSPTTTRPAVKSEKMSYHASQRSVKTLSTLASGSRSEARRALGDCPSGQAAISFEAKGGLVGKEASIFTFTIPFSSSVSFTLLNTDTRCIAGPSASPAQRPVAASAPSLKSTSRPTRAPTSLSRAPTPVSTSKPSLATSAPSRQPIATPRPTGAPTRLSRAPTRVPTSKPSLATSAPSRQPIATPRPTRAPTRLSRAPTRVPTSKFRPSRAPTDQPSSSSDDASSSYSASIYQTYGQTYG
jgi:hypothetical protein